MISLFDIELLSDERLNRILPREHDEDINFHRAKVALYFAVNNKLKDCPLLNKSQRTIFFNILKLSDKQLKDRFPFLSDRLVRIDTKRTERLIMVYWVFMVESIIDLYEEDMWDYAYNAKPYYYDNEYIEHLKLLSDQELLYYVKIFESPAYSSEIIKELARRVYDNKHIFRAVSNLRLLEYNKEFLYTVLVDIAYKDNNLSRLSRMQKYSNPLLTAIIAPTEENILAFVIVQDGISYEEIEMVIKYAYKMYINESIYFVLSLEEFKNVVINILQTVGQEIDCRELLKMFKDNRLITSIIFNNNELCQDLQQISAVRDIYTMLPIPREGFL